MNKFRAIIFKVDNTLGERTITQAVCGEWSNISEDVRGKAEYALAALNKQVVAVFKIKEGTWRQDGVTANNHPRWCFDAEDAEGSVFREHIFRDISNHTLNPSGYLYIEE